MAVSTCIGFQSHLLEKSIKYVKPRISAVVNGSETDSNDSGLSVSEILENFFIFFFCFQLHSHIFRRRGGGGRGVNSTDKKFHGTKRFPAVTGESVLLLSNFQVSVIASTFPTTEKKINKSPSRNALSGLFRNRKALHDFPFFSSPDLMWTALMRDSWLTQALSHSLSSVFSHGDVWIMFKETDYTLLQW